MKMKKKLFVAILFVNFYNSQISGDIFSVSKPSPDPLIKNIETPVSLNNGLANISYPIYTINTDDITIPVALNYYSKGVKVGDIASSSGLGWDLSVPYKISRMTRDMEDEAGANGYLSNDVYTNLFTDVQKRRNILSSDANFHHDFIPDQFYYSLPGGSGKFILDHFDKKTILQKFEDLKIDYTITNGRIDSFTIIDDKGNTYYYGKYGNKQFGKTTRTERYSFLPETGTYTTSISNAGYFTSWYLIRIKTSKGKSIDFDYESTMTRYFSREYDKTEGNSPKILTTYFSEIRDNDYNLKKISFPTGSVDFNYYSVRDDLMAGSKLTDISVNNSGKSIITYDLGYFYSDSSTTTQNGQSSPFVLTLDPQAKKRLFLKEVIENKTDSKPKITQFTYNPVNLPDRFSNSIDLWGYFNNASNGTIMDVMGLSGAAYTRNVNERSSEAGILKEVTYPTGLKIKYNYEHNRGQNTIYGNSYLKGNYFDTLSYIETIKIFKTHLETNVDGDENNQIFWKEFTIPKNSFSDSKLNIFFSYNDFLIEGQEDEKCEAYIAYMRDSHNNLVNLFPNRTDPYIITKNDTSINVFNLVPEKSYKLYVEAQNCNTALRNFHLLIDFKYDLESGQQIFYGDGKRISGITYEENGKILKKMQYEYKNLETNLESGKIIGHPMYSTILGYMGTIPILDPYGVMSGSIISSYNINSHIYSSVIEKQIDNVGSKGMTYYVFKDNVNGGRYSSWPYNLPIDNEWLRGVPLAVTDYKYNFNTSKYEKIRETVNNYSVANGEVLETSLTDLGYFQDAEVNVYPYIRNSNYYRIPLIRYYADIEGYVNPSAPYPDRFYLINPEYAIHRGLDYYFRPYYLTGGRFTKQHTITTEYLNDVPVSTRTDYFYNNPLHYQLTSQKTTFPDLSYQTTDYSYAHEKDKMLMIAANMVGIPLETVTKKGSKIISKGYTDYPDVLPDAQTGNLMLPKSVSSLDLVTGNLFTEVIYDQYDSKGNLLQYTTKSGISTAIVWGYNQTQPIAKIEGTKYSDVSAYISTIVSKSDTDNSTGTPASEQDLVDALDLFRKKAELSGFQITTYSYDPLIGVRSITPPNGIRQVYIYDTTNRLMEVREQSQTGNLLKEYQYHYKPSN